MVDKLIDNRGGLHSRITRRIYLHSFTLRECQQYLNEAGFDLDEYQILQNYMVMGGVPYYLSLLEPTMSMQQNIDNLFFSHDAILGKEFDELYNALFTNTDRYLTIVKLLSKHRKGLTRKEIEKATGFSGGSLSRTLTNLEQCDFIMGYNQIGNKSKQTIYKLVDFYTYFYYRFVENNRSNDENYWMHHFQDHSVEAWEGFSFELICQLHSYQIKFALGISGIATEVASWRSMTDEHSAGSQVDLVIKRVDKIVHLCEMKFCEKPFVISSDYATKLKNRKAVFCEKTGITRGVVNTFVTPYGVQKGKYQNIVHSEVTAKDLFLR